MASAIDASKPADGVDAEKGDMRANFAAAKAEIEALQAGGGGGGGGGDVEVADDGATIVATADVLNFTGGGVVVSAGSSGRANVAIAGAGESSLVIEDENVAVVSPVARINFAGAGVAVTDSGSGEALVTIPGGSGTASDALTLVEGTDFTAGGTFTVDPANARHRYLKVLGSVANSSLLTANMTVSVAPAAAGWGSLKGQAATVVVEKSETSLFTVSVSGEGTAGTGVRTLRVRDQWTAMVRRTGPGGPGPAGEYFAGIAGGANSRQAHQELLIAGHSTVAALNTDLIPIYDTARAFKGVLAVGSVGGLALAPDSGTTITIGSATHGTLRTLTSASSINVVLGAAAPEGTRTRVYKAGSGAITVTCQAALAGGSGAGYFITENQVAKATTSFIVAGWVEVLCQKNTGGDSAEFLVVDGAGLSLPSTVVGLIDFSAAGIKVPNGAAVSGALTVAAHGGGTYETSGNCTITPTPGFGVTLLLGGAHTIGAGGTVHSPATGDVVTIACFGNPVVNGKVKLFKTAAGSVINLPTA